MDGPPLVFLLVHCRFFGCWTSVFLSKGARDPSGCGAGSQQDEVWGRHRPLRIREQVAWSVARYHWLGVRLPGCLPEQSHPCRGECRAVMGKQVWLQEASCKVSCMCSTCMLTEVSHASAPPPTLYPSSLQLPLFPLPPSPVTTFPSSSLSYLCSTGHIQC
jgi:hypothetical protein